MPKKHAAARRNEAAEGTVLVQSLLHQTVSSLKYPSALMQAELWQSMACGGLTVCNTPAVAITSGSRSDFERVRQEIRDDGHSRTPIQWNGAIPLDALSDTIDRLQSAGYPPVFILMYDQAWALCEQLFEAMEVIMGPDVTLDTSLFAWALQRQQRQQAKTTGGRSKGLKEPSDQVVGNNFGTPHRDSRYSECHSADGTPTEISCWVPLVDVTTDNGCMMLVPAQYDSLFAQSDHPLHMKPTESMPWAHIRALPAHAGEVLLWQANTIHWGSSCGEHAEVPRKSIAMAFTVPRDGEPVESGSSIRRADLRAGLSLAQRVKLVAKSLLTYEHWHPSFDGFAPSVVEECLGSMSFR